MTAEKLAKAADKTMTKEEALAMLRREGLIDDQNELVELIKTQPKIFDKS